MKFKKFVLSKLNTRRIIVVVIILLFIAGSIWGSLIQCHYPSASGSMYIEVLYYASQIGSSLFVTSGVLIAVWQYYLSSKSSKTSLEMQQVQRAIDLSEYYKDNILRYLRPISYIFDESGISNILSKVKPASLENFDEIEMNSLFLKEDIETLDALTTSPEFINGLIMADEIYDLGLDPSLVTMMKKGYKKAKDSSLDNSLAENEDYKISASSAFVGNMFANVLNNMEYFAMHFSHHTADESVAYQSLHQTYLKIVHLLYFKIARTNNASPTKYYTNVIWLYKKWCSRQQQQSDKFLQNMRGLAEDGTVIEN